MRTHAQFLRSLAVRMTPKGSLDVSRDTLISCDRVTKNGVPKFVFTFEPQVGPKQQWADPKQQWTNASMIAGLTHSVFSTKTPYPLENWNRKDVEKLPAFLVECGEMAPAEYMDLIKCVGQEHDRHVARGKTHLKRVDQERFAWIVATLQDARQTLVKKMPPRNLERMEF